MLLVVEPPNRRVVPGFGTDQQFPIGLYGRLISQKVLQYRRRKLAAAATTVGEAG
jgi:hypothetical protein